MAGETSEGQPAPLNPQARADIDQALANAGVKGGLNSKATEDVDRALNQAGADSLQGSTNTPDTNNPSNKPYFLIQQEEVKDNTQTEGPRTESSDQNTWNKLPYKEMHVKDEPPSKQLSGTNDEMQIYTPQPEKLPEFGDARSAVGVSVRKFKAQGPKVYTEGKTFGTPMQYEGIIVDTPDGRRITVVKGSFSGATFVKEYDKQGKEISSSELYGNLGAILAKAADTYPPSELPHLIDATIRLQKLEKERLEQKIEAVGGRDKYFLQEAQRLVSEGKYSNIKDARWAVLMQTEVSPAYPQTENVISKAVDSKELPQDITDPEEIAKIRNELDLLARYGMIEEFARKLPGLMRVNSGNPTEVARFAFGLAKALTEAMLGRVNSRVDNVSFEDAAQLSQMELAVLGKEHTGSTVDILKYTWDKVASLQYSAGHPWGKPRFRII